MDLEWKRTLMNILWSILRSKIFRVAFNPRFARDATVAVGCQTVDGCQEFRNIKEKVIEHVHASLLPTLKKKNLRGWQISPQTSS